jgi:hypothetical protein
MVAADGSLYISDTGNNRVLVLPPDALPNSALSYDSDGGISFK